MTPSGSHSPRNHLIHACLFEIDGHSIHLRKHLSSFDSWGTCRRPSVLRLLRFVVIISPQIFSAQIHSPKTFYVHHHMHRSKICRLPQYVYFYGEQIIYYPNSLSIGIYHQRKGIIDSSRDDHLALKIAIGSQSVWSADMKSWM